MIEFLLERNIGVDDTMVDTFLRGMNRPDLEEKIAQKRGTAWLSLVRAGDAEGARTALQQGADIRKKDQRDGTALKIAIQNRDTVMVRVLLEAGADAGEASSYGVTLLHEAARVGSVEIADLLLKVGASPTAVNTFGRTPLTDAAMHQHGEVADRLIAGGAAMDVAEAILLGRREEAERRWQDGTPVNFAGSSGITALHAAARIGDVEWATELLDRGADVSAVDRTNHTALQYALETESLALVTLLLDRGADPAGTDSDSHSPLYTTAVMRRSEPLTRLLLERGAPLVQRVSQATITRMEARREERGDKDQDPEIRQRVMETFERRAQLVPALFDMHRLMNRAAKEGEDRVKAKWQETERLWAVFRTLIAFGAVVDTQDEDGNTPLCSLIALGAPTDLVQIVIEKGGRVNPTNHTRPSPLMLTVERGRVDVARLLLAAGANPNGGTERKSALAVAREQNLPEMVALLEEYGASEETRQAMVADLDADTARFFFRSAPELEETPSEGGTGITLPNLARLSDQMQTTRATKIADRRTRLQAEVEESERASA